jgi:pimeloyl-ACP methyl ester carboxylesterase
VIDVTPNQNKQNARMKENEHGTTALIRGPRSFPSLVDMIQATQAHAPTRSTLLIERGVVNNTLQLPDGTWSWLYDELSSGEGNSVDFSDLWDDVRAIERPLLLAQGGESAFVHEEDRLEFEQNCPDIRVEVVPKAGHSIQSDEPLALAVLLRDFLELK